ncbi:MAG: hypothetical protein ABJZ55_10290 [Fuerstiella sp.]
MTTILGSGPFSANAQLQIASKNERAPFAEKTVVFSPDRDDRNEAHEDIRIKSLHGVTFIVTRPTITEFEGKTGPAIQTWYKMYDSMILYSFDTRSAADEFVEGEVHGLERSSPQASLKTTYLEHSPAGIKPLDGKAIVVDCAKMAAFVAPGFKVSSIGGEAVYSWKHDSPKSPRVWQKVEQIERLLIFDSSTAAHQYVEGLQGKGVQSRSN